MEYGSNIHFTLTGHANGRAPDHATAYEGPRHRVFLHVFYTDGTEEEYQTEGAVTSLEIIGLDDYEQSLNYIRTDVDTGVNVYIYTYTENGVTTGEFGFSLKT